METNYIKEELLATKLPPEVNNSKKSLEKFQQLAAIYQQKKADSQEKLNENINNKVTSVVETNRSPILDTKTDKLGAEVNATVIKSNLSTKEIEKDWKAFKDLKESTMDLIAKKRKELVYEVFFTDLGEE